MFACICFLFCEVLCFDVACCIRFADLLFIAFALIDCLFIVSLMFIWRYSVVCL